MYETWQFPLPIEFLLPRVLLLNLMTYLKQLLTPSHHNIFFKHDKQCKQHFLHYSLIGSLLPVHHQVKKLSSYYDYYPL